MATNKGAHEDGCMCGSCNMMSFQHNTMYHVLRWLFAIAILVIVFSVGIQIGRLSSYLDQSGYGYQSNMRYYGHPTMMYSNAGEIYRTTTTSAPMIHATAPATAAAPVR